MDATSIINGISSEKPVLDLFLCMEMAWSLYERTGDKIRKTGAAKPNKAFNHRILATIYMMRRRRCWRREQPYGLRG